MSDDKHASGFLIATLKEEVSALAYLVVCNILTSCTFVIDLPRLSPAMLYNNYCVNLSPHRKHYPPQDRKWPICVSKQSSVFRVHCAKNTLSPMESKFYTTHLLGKCK